MRPLKVLVSEIIMRVHNPSYPGEILKSLCLG